MTRVTEFRDVPLPWELKQHLADIIRWYRAQPDGPLPFGLTNGFFLTAERAWKTANGETVQAAPICSECGEPSGVTNSHKEGCSRG